MKIIVTSKKDPASITIKEALLSNYEFREYKKHNNNKSYLFKDIRIIQIDTDLLYTEKYEQELEAELFIMASCHKSKSNYPSLLIHTSGNWTKENKFGGQKEKVCIANPNFIKNGLINLKKQKKELKLEYDVSLEVTHHGPTDIDIPSTFIELGSTKEEWTDKTAAKAIAYAIINSLENEKTYEPVIGVGGNHYANKFNKLLFNTKYSISHIIPKHAIDDLSFDTFKHAIDRSEPNPKICCIDWKGIKSAQRKKIIDYCNKLKIPYKKVKELIKESRS